MKKKKTHPAPRRATRAKEFNAADYPQLSHFARAYLHEDYKEEHGSAPGAMDEFCFVAHKRERDAVKDELKAFLKLTEKRQFDTVREWWTDGLGSAWLPPDKNALLALQTVMKEADKQRKR